MPPSSSPSLTFHSPLSDIARSVAENHSDLFRFSQVSKHWCRVAQPLLFRNLLFDWHAQKRTHLTPEILCKSQLQPGTLNPSSTLNAHNVTDVIIFGDVGIDIIFTNRSYFKALRTIICSRPPWSPFENRAFAFQALMLTFNLSHVVLSQQVSACNQLAYISDMSQVFSHGKILLQMHLVVKTAPCNAEEFFNIIPIDNILSIEVIDDLSITRISDFTDTLAGRLFTWDLPKLRSFTLTILSPRIPVAQYVLTIHGHKLTHLSLTINRMELIEAQQAQPAHILNLTPNLQWLATNPTLILCDSNQTLRSLETIELQTGWILPRVVSPDRHELDLMRNIAFGLFFPQLRTLLLRDDSFNTPPSKIVFLAYDRSSEHELIYILDLFIMRHIFLCNANKQPIQLFYSTRRVPFMHFIHC